MCLYACIEYRYIDECMKVYAYTYLHTYIFTCTQIFKHMLTYTYALNVGVTKQFNVLTHTYALND